MTSSAQTLIEAELAKHPSITIHPSLANRFSSQPFSTAPSKLSSIETSRYEDMPSPSPDATAEGLQKARIVKEYLASREINLSLLEVYGRNAWLVENYILEGILKGLEGEVEEMEREGGEYVRKNGDSDARYNRFAQEEEELRLLEDGWKKGVRGLLDVLVEVERMKSGRNK
ncbi:hypothetical protein K470DRAFT_256967 [Piedraia hortae CBS 480.64]|uniref:Uncharacterized protein n=1 Tax=Piedraia hortae CBS 480.64 TaxID=1314780 RepID=A0A6A7C145_9PEZI|nr:hypothetical protein K470DRAFT_256967 [Piedraia hortae CBS 480.64]